MTSWTTVAIVSSALALAGCGAEAAPRPGGPVERALERLEDGHTVRPVEGWTIDGLRLVSVERDGPNPLERRWVVGLDEASGAVVQGPALMARLRTSDAATLAERALSILIERHGTLPLRSGDERDDACSEAGWDLIVAPARDGAALVFWAVVEQSVRTLVEYRVATDEWSVEWREAEEILAAGGGTEESGPSFCEAVARCGCFGGCERVQPIRDPRRAEQVLFRAVDGPRRGERLVRAECAGGECPRVCVAAPGTTCVGALVPADREACEVTCPASSAPFHCETSADACRPVDHGSPGRAVERNP